MDKDTQLWNEYESLRDEIRSADSLNYQITGIVVAAVATLLTTGFTQADATIRLFVFLCAYIVTIPGYRLLQGNRRRTWRISTYLRASHQEKDLRRLGKVEQDFLKSWIEIRDAER